MSGDKCDKLQGAFVHLKGNKKFLMVCHIFRQTHCISKHIFQNIVA